MSDTLIIARPSLAATRLREALTVQGHIVATADDLFSALPELYLSPDAMHVYLGGEGARGDSSDDALRLAAADPGPLGRHTYSPLDLEAADIIAFEP